MNEMYCAAAILSTENDATSLLFDEETLFRFAWAAVEFAMVNTPAPAATLYRDAVPVTVHAPP